MRACATLKGEKVCFPWLIQFLIGELVFVWEQNWNNLMLSIQQSREGIDSGSLLMSACELDLFLRLWLPVPFSSRSVFFLTLSQIYKTLFVKSPIRVSPET